ncbi:MAG TPA: three-Cys-motif partner protein TcmP [Fimbriimonadaceae bacterium]|nr:three-Cys-motif partner protein TcmP [Fimbriimonadaceae bacterium]
MREWAPHSFEKVSILADYLSRFAVAAQRAPNRVYIDAFAGDTINLLRGSDRQFPGSAELALGVSPPFTHVRLFEQRAARAAALRALPRSPATDFDVIEGDCNLQMARVLAGLPAQAPTFAFLDPDGMELHWSTIRRIADHKRAYATKHDRAKVEMWVLFSTAGMVRMLGSNREFAEAQGFPQKVAHLYGAWGPWQAVWEARLDGRISPGDAKRAYLYLYMDRLAQLGYRHLLVRPIENSRNELYAMVFATDHPAGAQIMQWAQERERVRPRPHTLFDFAEPRPTYEDLHTGWREELPVELPPWVDLDG